MYPINLQGLMDDLAGQELVIGVFLACAGLVFLLLGHRIFKGLVAATYGVIGFVLGASLPVPGPLQLACGLVAALGFAVGSLFLMKPAVAMLAGGWAGFCAWTVVQRLVVGSEIPLFSAGVGFLGAVSLTFIMYHEIIATVTSLQGALLCIAGLISLVSSQSPALWSHLKGLMFGSPIFGPFMIVAGTVTGLCLQLSDMRHKDSGVSL